MTGQTVDITANLSPTALRRAVLLLQETLSPAMTPFEVSSRTSNCKDATLASRT